MDSVAELEAEARALRARVAELEQERRSFPRDWVDFLRALDVAGVGVWQWDKASNQARWSDQNYRVLGLEPGSVTPCYDNWIACVHPDDRAQAEAAVSAVVAAGERLDIVFRVIVADGAVRWINDIGHMLRDTDGAAVGMYGIQIDVTERVQDRQRLAELNDLLQSFMDSTPDWIFAKDRQHRFLFVNRSFASAQGRTPAEMVGRPDTDFWAPELCEGDAARGTRGFHDDDRDAFAGKVSRNPRDPATVQGGQVRLFDTLKSPLRAHDGAILGVLCYCRDVTERVRAEEARRELEHQLFQSQKLEALGTLAGGIAHDFNNLLTVILGQAELLLLESPTSTRHREGAAGILQAANRARAVVRQLLTWAKPGKPERRVLTLGAVLREALELMRAALPATVEIRCAMAQSDATFAADRTQIQQVLLNLATNAAHAMRERGGRVDIGAGRTVVGDGRGGLPHGDYVQITVRDDGPGIPAETLARIFDPFFTTKPPGEGSGLGLSVVHGIMRAHEGAVLAQSRPGQGATFELLFPEVKAPAESEPSPTAEFRDGDRAPVRRRVLLVDDEESVREITKRLLECLHCEVTTCDGAAAAMVVLTTAQPPFDALITDVAMPGMSGLELAARVRERWPAMVLVLATGNSAHCDQGALARLPQAVVLEKPFGLHELSTALAPR